MIQYGRKMLRTADIFRPFISSQQIQQAFYPFQLFLSIRDFISSRSDVS